MSVAFVVASVIGLIAIPVYLDFATANDSLRSVFDLGALVPLFRATAFGRAIVDLELCFALFCVAGVDRAVARSPATASDARSPSWSRSPARCSAAAAVLIVPGAPGTRRRPRRAGLTLMLDWLHLVRARCGSAG